MNFFMFMFLTSLCQILSQQTIKCWDFIITARCVYINQIMYIIIRTLQEKLILWSVCLSWNLFQTFTVHVNSLKVCTCYTKMQQDFMIYMWMYIKMSFLVVRPFKPFFSAILYTCILNFILTNNPFSFDSSWVICFSMNRNWFSWIYLKVLQTVC